jgi:Leucine-rich repeat (LRR) protein
LSFNAISEVEGISACGNLIELYLAKNCIRRPHALCVLK